MSPELVQVLALMEKCKVTSVRLKKLVTSGYLSDLFDETAQFEDRRSFCESLGLDLQRLGIYRFTVDYRKPPKERIEECKKNFPWRIDMEERMFEGDWMGISNLDTGEEAKYRAESFEARLLEMPAGISREDVLKKISRKDKEQPWMPADTDHMLAFATKYAEVLQKGDFRYIVGLGTTPSVLAAIFQGLGSGMSYNFIPITRKWKKCHDGGEQNRFLIVRPM